MNGYIEWGWSGGKQRFKVIATNFMRPSFWHFSFFLARLLFPFWASASFARQMIIASRKRRNENETQMDAAEMKPSLKSIVCLAVQTIAE